MNGPLAEVVRTFWDAVGERPGPDLAGMLAPAYVRHSAHADINATEFVSLLIERSTAFPDLRSELIDFVEDDTRVAYRWESQGTHASHYLGIPPTHRQVRMSGITIARVDSNGLICEEWSSWETEGVLRAMNVFSV